ncbi:AhpD-like protein [Aspergillus varians]
MSQQQSQPFLSSLSSPTTTPTISTLALPITPNPEPNNNNTKPTLYETGLQTRLAVVGPQHVNNTLSKTNAFTAPMQELITEWAWGSVWNRPGLDRKQRSLLNIGMLIALDRQFELGVHVRGAIRNGLSELEIREAVIHATVYCGAPAGMQGMRTVDGVLGEMEVEGEMERGLK